MRFIGTRAGFPLTHPLGHDARTPSETAARGFLGVCGSLFGLSGDPSELALMRQTTTDDRRSVVRFQQMNRGVPVFGGEIIVQLDNNRNVIATTGKVLPNAPVGIVPAITPAQARQTALVATARLHGVSSSELSVSTPQLWIYDPALVGPGSRGPRLVWRTEVTGSAPLAIRELVLIDAARGNVALNFNQIETSLQLLTYTANNTTSLPGTLLCDQTNPSCAGGDSHAAAAHTSAADTYNFYRLYHNRDGITGTGAPIVSTVHYRSGYANAAWTGTQMVYGDAYGFAFGDDVVGHELTHGVTQYTSNLFYYYQSGAINESLSDVWGEFVDQTNGRGNDAAGVRWLMGEDVTGLGPIRSMSDPPLYGDPDRMTSASYYTGPADNGGVHTNSGVNNKAAVLMVDGGTFNGQTIAALGIFKTAKIYYEAQTHLLTSAADYGDLHDALFQACNNLVGTADIFSEDCQEVRKATLAVEMNLQPVSNFNLDAPLCQTGQTPSTVFFDNLESGSSNFSTITLTGTNRWRYDSPYGAYAHSGAHFLYADDYPGVITDSSVVMTNGVTIPANAFLHFAHAYGFEKPNFDGGVVEYSTDGGSSWLDAAPLFFDNVGYSGTVNSLTGNPLAGRQAFVGDSHGYVSSRFNLSLLSGQTVKFRWRMGLDNGGFDWGWWLDDIRIYTCDFVQPPGAASSPTPADGTTGVGTNASLTWTASGATSYDVAFGTVNPPPQVATDLPSPSYKPKLSPNTTYYWSVTSRNTSGGNPGPVWSFTTASMPTDLMVLDTFTGSGAITSHLPDVTVGGQAWSVTGATPVPTLSGGVVGVTAGSGHVQATLDTGVSDIRMSVDYRVGASGQQLAALVVRHTDANNHLLVMFYQNAVHLYRRQAGVYTLLSSSPPLAPIASGSSHRLEVRTSGSQVTGWWDGLPVATATDTVQQNATRHGLDWNSTYDPTATFDNFEIRNIGAPLLPPGIPANPSPGDAATNVPFNATLSWSASGASSYDLDFGTVNPPSPLAAGLATTNYAPPLAGNTTYYWRVTARNTLTTTSGPVWTFTTGALPTDLLVRDTFAGGGLLTAHTPDVTTGGAAWLVTGGTPVPTLNSGVVGISGGSGHLQATLETGAPDIRMGVDYRVGSGPQLAALAFRLTDANNHLLLMFYQNALHFYRRQAGTYALLASSTPLAPVASGSTQRLEVRTSGTQLTGWWNGVQVVQATDAVQQNASRHGLDWNSAYDTTTTFDNLEIRNAGAPLAPPSAPTAPSPASGATDVAMETSLTWSAAGAASYDVAFGTIDPPSPAATGLTSTSYSPSLSPSTTYYWQVVAKNGVGSTAGPVWSFTTAALPADLLVTDSFTGSGLLTAHAPDVNVGGAPWTVTGGTPVPTLSGGVVGVTSGSGHLQATIETGAPDIRLGVDYRVGSGPQLAALAFRLTDANNHLLLMFYQNALHFYRKQAGAYALLASSAPLTPIASGGTQRLEVRTSGTQLTGWWNGVQVVQASDAVQQNATRHGLDWNSTYDATTTFDNLEIRNTGAPIGPPGIPSSPTPADVATGVLPTSSLSWSASGATSYDVAFGTVSPPPSAAVSLGSASYSPSMAANTTYFWRVTANNAIGSTSGPIWSFTTGALPIDLLVVDTFTGTGLLTAHTPDVNTGGGPWLVTGATPAPTIGGGVVGITAGGGHLQATLQTGAPDIRMGVDYRVGGGAQLAALAFRLTDANNHLLLMFYQNALHFYRRQAGVYTLLASSAALAPVASGSTQRLEVRTSGAQLTGWWNGVQVVQASDPFQQTATRHGIDWNSLFDPSTTFDNLEIRNLGAPLVPPNAPSNPSPANDATGVSTNASLTWSATGATSYDIAFGTVNPPSPVASDLATASYTPSLAPFTTYYWKVTARNFNGMTDGAVWTFTTGAGSPPAAPTSPSPASGATGVATNPLLTWSASGATEYDVAFGTSNPPPPVASGLTSASYTPPSLGGTATYFWRVTAINANGPTVGPVWSFTTAAGPPAVPSNPSPANGATGASTLSALSWSAAGATSYDVEFGRVNPPPVWAPGLTNPFASPVLHENSTYYWRVIAKNAHGSTPGPMWTFTTTGPTPTLIVSDTFIGTNGTFLYDHAADVNIVGGAWSITGFPPIPTLNNGSVGVTAGTQHTQATLLMGIADVSVAADYRVGAGPNQLAALVFRFTDQNNFYLMMFYQNALHFYRRLSGTYTLVGSSPALAPVAAGTTHRMEVRAVGPQLTGLWDSVPVIEASVSPGSGAMRHGIDWNPSYDATATFDNFALYNLGAAPALPGVPSSPNPANNATDVSTSAPLQWAASSGTVVYDVAFGTSMPLPVVVAGYAPGGSPSVLLPLASNTTYIWQVIARNAGGSTSGPVWTFTTGAASGCLDSDSDRLCDAYETNTGVFVSATNTGTSPVLADTDGDSIRDGDEVLGTIAGLNLPAMGLSPLKKNILLEYDWIDDNDEPATCTAHSHRPTAAMISRVAVAFAASPVNNPDGTTGITLIQDYGQGGAFTGGNFVSHGGTITGSLGTDFYNIKSANFATNRSSYFHYVVMPHIYSATPGSSGFAEIFGDDLIVSLGCFISTNNVANTIMHELGHNLGFQHGGNESCNWKPNYNSVMNYRFQFPGVDQSCNAIGNSGETNVLDYSRGTRITLNELNLTENAGVCGATPIDWNFNATIEAGISFDLNRTSTMPNASTPVDNNACAAPLTSLTDSNDWSNISFAGINDADGESLFRPTIDCNNPMLPRVVPPELQPR